MTSIQIPAPKLMTGDKPIPDDASITLSAAALRGYLQAYSVTIIQGIVDRLESRPTGATGGVPEIVAALDRQTAAIGATRVSVREVERDAKGMITRVHETVAPE